MTSRQRKFIEVFSGNATEAARLAGYKGNDATLAQVGMENLRKPEIAQAIRAREQSETQPHIMSRLQRQAMWSEMAQDKDLDPGVRLRASELLGKSECDFSERVHHEGAGGVQALVIDLGGGK